MERHKILNHSVVPKSVAQKWIKVNDLLDG